MKVFLKGFLSLAVALFAFSASSNAQTVQFNGIGSSAMFLELGQAASSSTAGLGATCVWSTSTSGVVYATDNSTNGGGKTETGNAWVAWTPNGSDCTTVTTATNIYAYLQTDSVVGDRCLFNACAITNGGSGSSPADLISSSEVALPNVVVTALTNAPTVNVAGTDIRPEDAEFAITRATTPCGTPITQYTSGTGAATQYLGLGYTNGATVDSYYSGSTFNVIQFALPGSFNVTPLGAVPVVVAVNGGALTSATNLNRSTLALYLDGSIGLVRDVVGGTSNAKTTVIIREPISGTYNTMEYNVPNNVELQTSQDVGLNQPVSQANCNGTLPATNPLHIENAAGGYRNRAIGTGQELSELFATTNGLGYSFWSVANFKGASNITSKYLTIDGVDPIETNYTVVAGGTGGEIPTPSNSLLGNVTLAHVADGTYPIWSLLRLVTTNSSAATVASTMASAAANFVSFGSSTSQPDFIPYASLVVERSHFTPPGIYASGSAPAPQNGVQGLYTEVGGDVGGVVIPTQVDADYASDTGATFTGRRQ